MDANINLLPPCLDNLFYTQHVQLLLENYQRLLKQPLLLPVADQALAEQVFNGNFVLLSHDTAADPCFNYANQAGLDLFEFSWSEFIGMPSRLSAEPMAQVERERLLAAVTNQGYIDNYTGVRIAKSGKRFFIKNAVVWNVYDQRQQYYGQAAYFQNWNVME